MVSHMEKNTWRRFYDATVGDLPPRQTLLDALEAWASPAGIALDLGCGAGRDTLALLAGGWRVHALDAQPEALERLLDRTPSEWRPRLTLHSTRFEAAELPTVDLANASFALPFCAPTAFPALWKSISAAVQPNGLFAGQLFGTHDDWATNPGMTFLTRSDLQELLIGWESIILKEIEYDGAPAVGPDKHWHIFHVVARRLT